MSQIGLVLGAGGAIGHAFHAGVLAAIAETTGWDARDAEVIVGTSAGSVIGGLLRAGFAPADIAARSLDEPISDEARRLAEPAEHARRDLPPIPTRPPRGGIPTMSAPGAILRAALPPWNVRPGALVAAAVPEGRVSTELVAAGLRPLFDNWPDATLWINAVELHTGRRVTFGRGTRVMTDVATAVAASCAIPSFFAPVVINGVRYVDGGVHSPTNADLLAGLNLDLVAVVSPMSMARPAIRFGFDQPGRHLSRFALAREVARIRKAGTPVITFQPTTTDITVMGLNAMDASRRADVTRTARDSAAARIERDDAADRIAILKKSSRRRA
jgi:NTE family protein